MSKAKSGIARCGLSVSYIVIVAVSTIRDFVALTQMRIACIRKILASASATGTVSGGSQACHLNYPRNNGPLLRTMSKSTPQAGRFIPNISGCLSHDQQRCIVSLSLSPIPPLRLTGYYARRGKCYTPTELVLTLTLARARPRERALCNVADRRATLRRCRASPPREHRGNRRGLASLDLKHSSSRWSTSLGDDDCGRRGPESSFLHLDFGNALWRANKLDDAIDEYRAAVRLAPVL
jgi:hypothetical protein